MFQKLQRGDNTLLYWKLHLGSSLFCNKLQARTFLPDFQLPPMKKPLSSHFCKRHDDVCEGKHLQLGNLIKYFKLILRHYNRIYHTFYSIMYFYSTTTVPLIFQINILHTLRNKVSKLNTTSYMSKSTSNSKTKNNFI